MAEDMNPLEELLVDELKDIYSAENQIIKALPKMAKGASSPELKRAFERHLEETRRQVERLEQIGEALEIKLTGKKCKGMEGLIEEGKEILEEDLDENAIDAGLIGAAQKVEHYEIAAYGTARRAIVKCCGSLGELGGVLLRVHDRCLRLLLHTIHEAHAGPDQRKKFRAIHLSPALFSHREQLERHHQCLGA